MTNFHLSPESKLCFLVGSYCESKKRPQQVEKISLLAALCGEAYLMRAGLFDGREHDAPPLSRLPSVGRYALAGRRFDEKNLRPDLYPLDALWHEIVRIKYPLHLAPDPEDLWKRVLYNGLGSFGYARLQLDPCDYPLLPPFLAMLELREPIRRLLQAETPRDDRDLLDYAYGALGQTIRGALNDDPDPCKSVAPAVALEIAAMTFFTVATHAPLLDSHCSPESANRNEPLPDLTYTPRAANEALRAAHIYMKDKTAQAPSVFAARSNLVAVLGAMTGDALRQRMPPWQTTVDNILVATTGKMTSFPDCPPDSLLGFFCKTESTLKRQAAPYPDLPLIFRDVALNMCGGSSCKFTCSIPNRYKPSLNPLRALPTTKPLLDQAFADLPENERSRFALTGPFWAAMNEISRPRHELPQGSASFADIVHVYANALLSAALERPQEKMRPRQQAATRPVVQ